MKRIMRDTLIGDIIELDIKTTEILKKHGLDCLGCPASESESLAEAAKGHGANIEDIILELNRYLTLNKKV